MSAIKNAQYRNIPMAVGGPVLHSAPSEHYKGGDMMRTPDSFRGETPPKNPCASDEDFGKGDSARLGKAGSVSGNDKVEKTVKPRT